MNEVAKKLAGGLEAGYVLVHLVTWEEDRGRDVVGEAAKKLGRQVSVWSVASGFGDHKGPGPADPGEALSRISATDDARLFVLLDFHAALEDPLAVRRLRELCSKMGAGSQGVVIVGPVSKVPVELEKEMVTIDLPPPGREDLACILDECIKATGHAGALAKDEQLRDAVIRAALGLTAREIRRMLKRVLYAHQDFGMEHVREVLEEKRQVLRRTELLEFYDVDQTLDHVGGLDLLKKWLADRAEAFTERAREYGLPGPKGLLLLGVQGCGKSLSAKAVSGLWGIPLIRLDLSVVLGGKAEGEQIRRSLRMAEELAPCVLWIDEIEKGFSSHLVGGGAERGNVARAFATFLTWLQEKKSPVYVIATANSISEMPAELVRKGRFDDIFFVDLPRETERAEIFKIHLEKRRRDPGAFDLAEMAKASVGFSGSEIEQAVIAAMYDAFTDGREVETKDVVRALRETVPLSETLEEQIKELRDWAKTRARPASLDTKLMDLLDSGKKKK
jgi:SpoVK/Ycf46/Vps4 family AAA+-type ATPase